MRHLARQAVHVDPIDVTQEGCILDEREIARAKAERPRKFCSNFGRLLGTLGRRAALRAQNGEQAALAPLPSDS
jgi:hypothetical protein